MNPSHGKEPSLFFFLRIDRFFSSCYLHSQMISKTVLLRGKIREFFLGEGRNLPAHEKVAIALFFAENPLSRNEISEYIGVPYWRVTDGCEKLCELGLVKVTGDLIKKGDPPKAHRVYLYRLKVRGRKYCRDEILRSHPFLLETERLFSRG